MLVIVEGMTSFCKELPETGVRCQWKAIQTATSVIENRRRSAVNSIVFDLGEIPKTPNEGGIQQSVSSEKVLNVRT
jgi:hypothetical protein